MTLDELASAPDGPVRTTLLARYLVDAAAAPSLLPQLAAVLGEPWPAAALRALRAVVPASRPQVLLALAPWLAPSLARDALDLVALFDAPVDIERTVRALAPKLVDVGAVTLLRVLRHLEDPARQAQLLCAVAGHADGDARAGLLAAAARVAQRVASEPERLEAVVAVAILAGGDATLAAWDQVAGVRRRDLRVRLLAALAPKLPITLLPGLLTRLVPQPQELEVLLLPVITALRGEALLDALALFGPLVGNATAGRDRLLTLALERLQGLDLLVAVEAATRRLASLPARLRDEHLGRALVDLDDAGLAAAAPTLARLDPHARQTLLGHALARMRGASLVAALERLRRGAPTLALPDAALVRAASTCARGDLDRVTRLVDDAEPSALPVIVALRRGVALTPALLRRCLTHLVHVPRKHATALMVALAAGTTLADTIDVGPPEDRRRAVDNMFVALFSHGGGARERAAVLALLLPRLPVERAAEALLTGLRWHQSADTLLGGLLTGRPHADAVEILAALATSRVPAIVAAVDQRLAALDPAIALPLADRLRHADARVVSLRRRLALLTARPGGSHDPDRQP